MFQRKRIKISESLSILALVWFHWNAICNLNFERFPLFNSWNVCPRE